MFTGVVYKYTSPSGKIYIGQTRTTIRNRAGKDGIRYRGNGNGLFWAAICKYGFENMKSSVLYTASSSTEADLVEILNGKEKYYIDKLGSNNRHIGYNLTDGGDNYILSEYSRRRMSDSMRGRNLSDGHKRSISESTSRRWVEGGFTEDRNRKISERSKGKIKSESHRMNISVGRLKSIKDNPEKFEYLKHPWNKGYGAYMKGSRNHFFGRTHTDETKKLISKKLTKHDLDINKIIELRDSGLSFQRIGDIMGVSRKTISKRYYGHENYTKRDGPVKKKIAV